MQNQSDNGDRDMYMLLGKLDGKLDGIIAQLVNITAKQDNHESRIQKMESGWMAREHDVALFRVMQNEVDELKDSQLSEESARKTLGKVFTIVWTLAGANILAFGTWAIHTYMTVK